MYLKEEYDNEDNLILEFANIDPEDHKFGVDVKLHLMQPENKKLKHGPRIKVFKQSWNKGPNFTITINNTPKVIGEWSDVVTKKELDILLKAVERHKKSLIAFWNDSSMTTRELTNRLDKERS